MKKILAMLLALFFMTATSGLVLAQDAPATTPVKKVHKVHKSKKKHHVKKKQAAPPSEEAPASK